jgi:hypothetical protein
MSLYREQPEPYMRSEKSRKRHSYKWAKRQMNKWRRLQNRKIKDEDESADKSRKKVWHGWEY